MTTIDENGNINAIKGDTLSLLFTDVKINGVAVNFSGYTAKLTVALNESAEPVLELTESDGIDLSTAGQITILKDASDMDFPARTYFYDLELTDPNGFVETWFNKKKFVLQGEIAK